MKRHIPITAIVSALLIFAIVPSVTSSLSLSSGQNAPDFHLADLSNTTHSLSDYKGSVVLLDFFSVKCSTCQVSAKNVLVPLYYNSSSYAKALSNHSSVDAKVQFLSVETTGASADTINSTYVNPSGITWPVLTSGVDLKNAYNANHTPTIYIIDAKGKIVVSMAHPLDIEKLNAAIDNLLEAIINEASSVNPDTQDHANVTPTPPAINLNAPSDTSKATQSSDTTAASSTTSDAQEENTASMGTENCSMLFAQQTSLCPSSQTSLLCSPALLMPIVSSTLSDQAAAISAEASALAVPAIALPAQTTNTASLPLQSVYEFSLLGLGAPALLIGVLYLLLRRVN
jgi:cytochrome oxidase Cu insertion factor (SCO1/SenC/PrrC family)